MESAVKWVIPSLLSHESGGRRSIGWTVLFGCEGEEGEDIVIVWNTAIMSFLMYRFFMLPESMLKFFFSNGLSP